jgi:hypothetical protein
VAGGLSSREPKSRCPQSIEAELQQNKPSPVSGKPFPGQGNLCPIPGRVLPGQGKASLLQIFANCIEKELTYIRLVLPAATNLCPVAGPALFCIRRGFSESGQSYSDAGQSYCAAEIFRAAIPPKICDANRLVGDGCREVKSVRAGPGAERLP